MPYTKELTNSMKYTIWKPKKATKKVVIYFHGGGLIYGTRNDIPLSLVTVFLNNEIEVISIDYPLAPNSPMNYILKTTIDSFIELYDSEIKPNNLEYILCGRSAGSYLMFWLTNQIISSNKFKKPQKIINFYGYYDLNSIDTQIPFDKIISVDLIKSIDTNEKIHDDPTFSRYLYYAYLVSHNKLLSAYQINLQSIEKYKIPFEQLIKFPPIFSTASVSDKEVPFTYSKSLQKLSSNNKFYPVYYLKHDFLKNVDNPQVKQVLINLATWL